MKTAKFKRVVLLPLLCAILAGAQERLRTTQLSDSSLGQRIFLTGTVPPWVGNAKKLGTVDDNKRVAVTFYLRWRNQQQLERLITDQTTPGSPRYGQFLTPPEFHARFSPRAEDLRKVQNALSELGFKLWRTPDSGLFVPASATVLQIKNAFHVSQDLYSYRGKTLRAHAEDPSIPASLANLVTYVAGLDDSHLLIRPADTRRAATGASPALKPPFGAPPYAPCSTYFGDNVAQLESPSPFPYGSDLPWWICGYTPQQIQAAYGANKVKETGAGVRVAITDLYASPTIVEDVNRYSTNHGLPLLSYQNFVQIVPPRVNQVPPGDPCGYQGWWAEETLDVTAVHSMAPDAFIFYVGGACDQVDLGDGDNAIEPLYEVIDNRLADIVTNSWGYNGEADIAPGEVQSDNAEFMQAAAEGMSVLFASGDCGDSTPCGQSIGSGSWQATSPYVTAVGGTTLGLKNASGEKSDWGWGTYYTNFNDAEILDGGRQVTDQGWLTPFLFGAGSGGGPSLIMLEPSYQKKVVPELLATQTYLSDGLPVPLDPPRRVTPDISMVGDGSTGFLVGETGTIYSPPLDPGCVKLSETTEYCESSDGGTSVSSPLFAGVLALVNERRFSNGGGPIGFANPALYRLPVGDEGSSAPIIDVRAPTEPTSVILSFCGFEDSCVYAAPNIISSFTINSVPRPNGHIVEGVDTSLRTAPGYDNVTGLGTPNVPALINALGH